VPIADRVGDDPPVASRLVLARRADDNPSPFSPLNDADPVVGLESGGQIKAERTE
jgi:hypothetical protein